MLQRVTEQLQYFFQTTQPVLGFPTAGSGSMEAAVVNCFSPGDEVLVVSIGVFGKRFAKIATIFGLHVHHLAIPWGQAADPAAVQACLAGLPRVRGVFLTHNETSTGVMNDLAALARAIREKRQDVLIVVDAISSLGCVDLRMDEWDLDVVLTASQKGWMAPPGLAMIGVSERAMAACERATLPRFYWDFRTTLAWLRKGQTPWTPPVNVYFGLDVALQMMREEGRETIFQRHQATADLVRSRVQALGLHLFADSAYASNTVTALHVPTGIQAARLLKALREEERVVIAGGQEELDGRVIRIGHLGYVPSDEMVHCLAALQRQLVAQGYALPVTTTAV
jgi:aspartate aminotransferase-like enzyme